MAAGAAAAWVRLLLGSAEDGAGVVLALVGVAEVVVVGIIVDAVVFLELPGDVVAPEVDELFLSVSLQWLRRFARKICLQ